MLSCTIPIWVYYKFGQVIHWCLHFRLVLIVAKHGPLLIIACAWQTIFNAMKNDKNLNFRTNFGFQKSDFLELSEAKFLMASLEWKKFSRMPDWANSFISRPELCFWLLLLTYLNSLVTFLNMTVFLYCLRLT